MHNNIGLMNCSGACFPAILARRACNIAAYTNDSIEEVCLVEHTMPLLSGEPTSIEKSIAELKNYDEIIAVSGCGSACTTLLLAYYGITPKELHISEFSRVPGKTPPFTSEEVDKLLRENLDNTVKLIQNASQEITDRRAVREVVIGSPKQIKVGGQLEGPNANKPVVAFEVFDYCPPLPSNIKKAYGDKLNNPVEWAKFCVDEYGAEMICLELLSTNPYAANLSVEQALKTVVAVLEAVDVPLIIGGSGDVTKDSELLPAVAKVAAGRRVLLSSITLDNYQAIVPAAAKYNHTILASTTMSIETAIAFNRDLIDAGIDEDSIVMDLSTCPLGYGFEFSYSLVERSIQKALTGNLLAQYPILYCPANSWAAYESRARDPKWGDPAQRGTLWETTAGVGGLMAGAHLLLILDPNAGLNLNNFIEEAF